MIKLIGRVFQKFEDNNIIYCHWKSNERLKEFVNGEEDLDLLFYPEDERAIDQAFKEAGIKKFDALPLGKYPNIKDYLGYDEEAAKLVHFHVHFALDIGEKNVKRYTLPWVDEILKNRIKHESEGLYISSHEHELLLLIIREILRRPPRHIYFKKSSIKIKKGVQSEFNWLKLRIDYNIFLEITEELAPEIKTEVPRIIDNGISKETILKCRKLLKSFRKSTRNRSSVSTELILQKEKYKKFVVKVLNKLRIYTPTKRIYPNRGIKVGFIGSDGAGKSTTIQNVYKFYKRKIFVQKLYMGNPKIEKYIPKRVFWVIRKTNLLYILNLYTKKRNLTKSEKLKHKGSIVLFDRFPQSQYAGPMDGPKMQEWQSSRLFLFRWISQFEKIVFQRFQNTELDLLIKLNVSPEVSFRRGGIPLERANRKTDVVKNINYPKVKKVVELNTDAGNFDEIEKEIIKNIWESI